MEKIFEARTEREAVEKAVRTFGVNEEYIEIKIISKKKGRFLGLNSKVVINASVRGMPSSDSDSDGINDGKEKDAYNKSTESIEEISPQKSLPPHASQSTTFLPLTDHQKKEGAAIIESITAKMNIEVDVEFQNIDGNLFGLLMVADPKDQHLLIGKHGKNIDALQVLVNSMIQKKYNEPLEKVVIEIENYRNKRNSWLIDLAQRKAHHVLQSKQSYTLEEMPPYDRKLVHSTISDIPGVSTESIGNGYCKRLTIFSL